MQVKNILGSLWIFILVLPSGIRGKCSTPTTSDHVVVYDPFGIFTETFEAESAVELRCHPGYEPNARIPHWYTCGVEGQWMPNPEKFTCKKSCGHPGEVANGYYEFPDGALFGATVRAVCKTGYFTIGENTRTCLADGQWDGRDAVCEVVRCGPPPMISNGRPLNDQNEYEYANVVEYVCNSDYTLLGDNDLDIVCLENGNWSKEPRCVAVNCDRPDVPNARRVDGGSGPYGYRSTLRYECNMGYKMTSDTDRMVCLEHGWSSIPKCKDECRSPLGMESGNIPDKSLTAFSTYIPMVGPDWEPRLARLNNKGIVNAWMAETNDQSQWLQVDLGSKKQVTGIITQGANKLMVAQYVSAFKVKYSNDSDSWQVLKDPKTKTDKIFKGNVDNDTPKGNMFDPPFYARFVRFWPWEWKNSITVRMELLGCRDN
ncbi:membrane cofactor protein-like isoform X2 [Sardina pilchardus]|uniref:membrane cofactor protein-like isoform X2 n=1 Tax=Sardina pilchardus TaxID=27697 RepID=UPI002E12407E